MHSVKFIESNSGKALEYAVAADNNNDLLKEIAMELIKFIPPATVTVSVDGAFFSEYALTIRSGTLLISELSIITGLKFSDYDTRYLTMISPEHNSYKFYKLSSEGGIVTASYGRIGAGRGELYGERSCTYPMSMYWPKYYEKISKGYADQSDIFVESRTSGHSSLPVSRQNETASEILYRRLRAFAEHLVETSCINSIVTDAMVERGEELIEELYKANSVEAFNAILLKLFIISPRKINKVRLLLAETPNDYAGIVKREENLLTAMKVMLFNGLNDFTRGRVCPFGCTIDIVPADDTQKEKVMHLISEKLKPKVKNIYKVTDSFARERFDAYVNKRHISATRLFWHGSRNENWLSIISNRLSLHPNAKITGKMFGNGIYFSPSSMKSWGYTSMEGARWSGSGSGTGFMGLYTTAYGNPLDVYTAHAYSENTLGGKDCVHAHSGRALKNDEIIFYNEDAMVLDYLVELAA